MNRQKFDLTTTKGKKHFKNLLNTLIDYNSDSENNSYNDIHIKQEDNFVVIEWNVVYSYNGGAWKFVETDEAITKRVEFPDGHYEYIFPDRVESTLKQWHKDNPDWQQNENGDWVNTEENRVTCIKYNIESWIMREAQENDSTFAESTVYYKELQSLEDLLLEVPLDVRQRTDYIIMNYDLAAKLYPDKVPSDYNEMEGVIKLKKFNTKIKSPHTWGLTPITYHIYTIKPQHIFPSILFVTDSNYLIYRCNMEHERKAG